MSLVTPTKIFVDTREEITFIIERIINADKDRVILVVPENSLVLSSIISLKILQRRLAKSSKLAILVTEDEYGQQIAHKVGFAVTPHVSDVNVAMWEAAEIKKKEALAEIDSVKEDLLGKRSAPQQVADDSVAEENESDTQEVNVEEEHTAKEEINNISNHSNKSEEVEAIKEDDTEQSQEEKELEKELKRYQKPRQGPKEVDIDGVTIIAGGDVRRLHNQKKDGNISDNSKIEPDMAQDKKADFDKIGERPTKQVKSFTGTDFTKKVKDNKNFLSSLTSIFSFNPANKKNRLPQDTIDPVKRDKLRRRRIMIGGALAAAILLLFGFGWFYITNVFSSVDVEVTFTTQDVEFQEKIVASAELEEVDAENLELPALLLEEENLNTQLTGEATGEGTRGERAAGTLRFTNINVESEVTISEGTQITNVINDLIFILQEDVTLAPITFDELDTVVASEPVDAVVEAAEPGENYNFGEDDPTSFVAQGFDSDSLRITRFEDFEGGSSETFTAVTEANVESLKEDAQNELVEEGTEQLRAFVPRGYILLEETIEFEVEEERPFPDIGEEAEDGTFSYNLSGTLTALAVREEDLEEVARQAIANQGELDVAEFEDYEFAITEVVRDGNRVSFNVDSSGLFANQLSEDEIIELISGTSLDEAVRILSDLDEIEDASVTYSPGFIPNSFQRVPNDAGRITIDTN